MADLNALANKPEFAKKLIDYAKRDSTGANNVFKRLYSVYSPSLRPQIYAELARIGPNLFIASDRSFSSGFKKSDIKPEIITALEGLGLSKVKIAFREYSNSEYGVYASTGFKARPDSFAMQMVRNGTLTLFEAGLFFYILTGNIDKTNELVFSLSNNLEDGAKSVLELTADYDQVAKLIHLKTMDLYKTVEIMARLHYPNDVNVYNQIAKSIFPLCDNDVQYLLWAISHISKENRPIIQTAFDFGGTLDSTIQLLYFANVVRPEQHKEEIAEVTGTRHIDVDKAITSYLKSVRESYDAALEGIEAMF